MAGPGRNLLSDKDEDEKPKGRNLLGITPAQEEKPDLRGTLEEADAFIDTTQGIEARALANDVQGTGMEVRRDSQTGEPYQAAINTDPFAATPPDQRLQMELLQPDPFLDQSMTLLNGAFLGGASELAALMNPDLPATKQGVDDAIARAYGNNFALSMATEAVGAAPWAIAGTAAMGPRVAGALEGAVYGFNDPFFGDDSLGNRALNAVPGGIAGRVLGGIGEGAASTGRRLDNAISGRETIQRVAEDDFGIRLTEGQVSGDPGQQSWERRARAGVVGKDASDVVGQAMTEQERRTIQAGRGLAGENYAEANDAAAAFADGAKSRASQKQTAINDAYETARSKRATLQGDGVASMPDGVMQNLDDDVLFTLEAITSGKVKGDLYPGFQSALGVAEQLRDGSVIMKDGVQQVGPAEFKTIELARQNINAAIDAAKNPADRRAALKVKGAFDTYIDDAVDAALFDADDGFLEAYQGARALRAEFGREWEANKVFERIIEKDASPEQAINFVLGGGRLAGDKNFDVLVQLKGALSEDPEAWQALQEAYVKKILRQSERTFNPKVLRDNLDELLIGKNQSFAQTLLDDDQYQQLRRFRSVVDSMIPPEGVANPSGSGYEAARAARDVFAGPMRSPGVRLIGRAVVGTFEKVGVKTAGIRARSAMNPSRGMDTRTIESGFPENRFGVPEEQLPTGPAGPDGTGGGAPPSSDPLAEAMGGRIPDAAYEADANLVPSGQSGTRFNKTAADTGQPEPPLPRMKKPAEPTTLTGAVRALGGIKTRYTSEGVQKNLSRGDFESIPGLIDDTRGRGADDMVRRLQEDGFDITDENDLFNALDNERMGAKTYRSGEGEIYEAELDAWDQYINQGDEPVQNDLFNALDNERMGAKTYRSGEGEIYEAELDAWNQYINQGDEPVQNGIFGFGKKTPSQNYVERLSKTYKSEKGDFKAVFDKLKADESLSDDELLEIVKEFTGYTPPGKTRDKILDWAWKKHKYYVSGSEASRAMDGKSAFGAALGNNSTVYGGAIGAGVGALAPADSNEERLRNMAIGGAAGAGAGRLDRHLATRGDEPVQNGLPKIALRNRADEGIKTDRNARDARKPRIMANGRPTLHYKVHEMANSGMTRSEIAEEMEMSENAVSVVASQLRNSGFEVRFARQPSAMGASGERREMAIALKQQGLSNKAIADRINAKYGPEVVHGAPRSTENGVASILSKARRRLREAGKPVEFGVGVMIPSAAGSMLLNGEQSGEQVGTILGTEEEKRAAMARAMLGGY